MTGELKKTERKTADKNSRSARHAAFRGSLDILEIIRDRREGMTIQQIIGKARLPRASAYQLVAVLLKEGFLARGSDPGAYVLGRQSYRLALGYAETPIC